MLTVIALFSGLISLGLHIYNYFADRAEMKVGADAQTLRDLSTTRRAETRIAMAEADAPRTDDQVDQRLKDHTL